MEVSQVLLQHLKAAGLNFYLSVPCVFLQDIIKLLEHDADITYTPVTREEEAIGVASGAYLGGNKPVILMQSSGLGNCVNAICSLSNFYNIPILFLISHRGTQVEKIAAQKPMGEIMTPLLSLVNIDCYSFSDPAQLESISEIVEEMYQNQISKAILLHPTIWEAKS